MLKPHQEFINIYNEIEKFLRIEYLSSTENKRIGHTSLIHVSSEKNYTVKHHKEDLLSKNHQLIFQPSHEYFFQKILST